MPNITPVVITLENNVIITSPTVHSSREVQKDDTAKNQAIVQ
ncbi:hypothetical protein [Kosakonia phage Kc283]|uniref:Uncharacterized protein n=1 Tax=Kosakonia phage Kc283 TaxID=2863195 RepID=A0AAE7WFH1_9CAUD|nr:hypothetical protein PP755_gp38 [Kosakonia phage Kc283]QYN79840.1 hypothetical protein [Kosakonia phage Kc283]